MARLHPLSEQGAARSGDDRHDVRDWTVRTRVDDREVGRVHDVLLDADHRTRYLDVEAGPDHHVLIPSGETRIDPSTRTVHVPGLDRDGIRALPRYDQRPDTITDEYSRSLNTAFDDAYHDEHRYDRAEFHAAWINEQQRGRDARTEVDAHRESRLRDADEVPGTPHRKAGVAKQELGNRTGDARRKSSGTLGRLDRIEDVEVADHSPDPRGWQVVDRRGDRLGRVDHLIGDTESMEARYLTVELDSGIAEGRRVLMPVGHVHLDSDDHRVVARAVDRAQAGTLPAYDGGPVDREYERELTRRYSEAYEGERAFEHPRYRARYESERR